MWDKIIYGSVLLAGCGLLLISGAGEQQDRIGDKLRPEVLRFHVLADSDEDRDQELKLLVRDALLAEVEPLLADAGDLEEARDTLAGHAEELERLAEDTLRQQDCDLPVQIELARDWFPVKRYGNLIMPAGEYEALRVRIGSAVGRNWWCMLFPGLCFVEETYELPEEDAGPLQQVLTEEEFGQIWQDDETEVRVRFWLWEQLEHFLQPEQHE